VSGTLGALFFGGGGASVEGILDVRTAGSALQNDGHTLRYVKVNLKQIPLAVVQFQL